MKPITSYKELLESFLKQIKESEVTDERIIDLHMYIESIKDDSSTIVLDKETWRNTFNSLRFL